METAGVEERTNEVAVADKNDKHTGSGVPALLSTSCLRPTYSAVSPRLVQSSFI